MLSPKLQIHCICPYPTPTWCYSRADIEHFAIDTKPLIMGDRLLISISFVFLYRKFISMRAIKRQGILKLMHTTQTNTDIRNYTKQNMEKKQLQSKKQMMLLDLSSFSAGLGPINLKRQSELQ